jgi:hypothetical protein
MIRIWREERRLLLLRGTGSRLRSLRAMGMFRCRVRGRRITHANRLIMTFSNR